VASNRNNLTGDIHGLTKVTNVLTREKKAITQFTDVAPFALANLSLAYDPKAMTLDSKADTTEPISKGGPSGAVCQLLHTLGLDAILNSVAGCQSPKHTSAALTGGPTPNNSGSSGGSTSTLPPGTRESNRHPSTLSQLLGVTK